VKDRNLQYEKIDPALRDIVRASVITDDELDEIVGQPYLYKKIDSRIKDQKPSKQSFMPAWLFNRYSVASAAAALVVIATLSFALLQKRSNTAPVEVTYVSNDQDLGESPVTIIRTPDQPTADQDDTASTDELNNSAKRHVEKSRPKRSTVTSGQRQVRDVEDVSPFYPITYAENSDMPDEGEQIVRVELPRSSLFAMGLNVPVENEMVNVRADLLIGSDGVTKAVRLVR
jgi:hypothetical protein